MPWYFILLIVLVVLFALSLIGEKQYITGAHGSGSARQKAKYREQRANRHKH